MTKTQLQKRVGRLELALGRLISGAWAVELHPQHWLFRQHLRAFREMAEDELAQSPPH